MNKDKFKKYLLGLGFDCSDGHKRVTLGDNFRLYGGSDKTHKYMQDKAMQFNDQLDRRGKKIEEICDKEFLEIADKVGLAPAKNSPGTGAENN